MSVDIRVLGTLEVADRQGAPIEIGGTQPRIILAVLVAADGRMVSSDSLIDAIWGDSPPVSAAGTLQTYVSRLRRALGAIGGSIVRDLAGYRLEIDRRAIDVHQFEALADEGRTALDAGDPDTARALLVEAETLWRGPALLEVRDRPALTGFARRLDDRRLAAIEDRLAAELALGRHPAIVGELGQLTSEHPLREGLWELLAIARYRSGMQADALRALTQARSVLVEELGVEPSARLRDLEQAILAQDPALELHPTGPTGATARRAKVAPRRAAVTASSTPPEHIGNGDEVGPVEWCPDSPAMDRPALVGRSNEMERLRQGADAASGGRPCVAVVQGEAGVGKTRLVEELADDVLGRGGRVVWGRCLEGGAAPAYWPWLSVIRPLRSEDPHRRGDPIDQLLDATGSALAAPAIGAGSPLLDGVLALLERPSHGPLLVVIEDVQWADPESLELARQVVSGLSTGKVLLVITLRDGEDAEADAVLALLATASRRPGTERLRLGGLSAEHTAALLAQTAGRTVPDGLARAVHERTEGNPFYAIELQRLLDDEGCADAAAAATVPIPIGVRDVVRQRLVALPGPTTELLAVAAIVGRELDLELVAAASGRSMDTCLDDLELAIEHRLLVSAGSVWRFSHALVREVVVDSLSALRRARAHLAVADAIEALGRDELQAEVLAEHLWAAVPIGAGRRAADALERAADVALRRFALGSAADLLARALELRRSAGDDAGELDTLMRLVWVLRASHGYRGGLDHYARGAELAERLDRHDVALDMQWGEWAGHDTACDFDRARPVAERFRARAAASHEPLVQMVGYAAWAIQRWHDGDLTGSAQAFATVAAARGRLGADAVELSMAAELTVLTSAFGLYVDEQVGLLDDPEAAFAATAASLSGNLPTAIVWTFASTSAASAGDLARLERCARRVLDAEGDETLGFWGRQVRMYLGAALIATGRADEGRPMFAEGHDGYRAAGMRTGVALMLAAAASAEVAAGDLDRAAAHAAAARAELDQGERWPTPYVLLAEADVAEASGAPSDEVAALRAEARVAARATGARVAEQLSHAATSGRPWFAASESARAASRSAS